MVTKERLKRESKRWTAAAKETAKLGAPAIGAIGAELVGQHEVARQLLMYQPSHVVGYTGYTYIKDYWIRKKNKKY